MLLDEKGACIAQLSLLNVQYRSDMTRKERSAQIVKLVTDAINAAKIADHAS